MHSSARIGVSAACAAIALAALSACQGAEGGKASTGVNGGTVIVATAAEPNTLFPPLATGSQSTAIVAQIFDRLAEIGDSLNTVGDAGFQPRLAKSWRWAPDSLSIAFSVDPTARWHDGRPVRSADVKFSFDVATDPATGSPGAGTLSNIDSVSIPDSLTAVFWYKRRTPQQFYETTYNLWVVPQHLLANVPHDKLAAAPFGRAPVGSGRFRFVKWVPGQSVEIGADPDNYRGRAHLDRVVWSISPDFGSATISLINGESDFFEAMRPDAVGQLARNSSLRVVPYPGLDYAFLLFNERASDGSGRPHPIFGDREVRRALTMAVDRPRLVQSVFDSLATTSIGPVPQAIFPDGPKLQQIPFNLARARQLLDSLGWTDPDGDGVRARGGVPLAFTIVVPASSVSRQRAAVLLQEQLRAAGARVELESVEINAFMDRQAKHTFDATMGAWRAEPSPGGILQTWGSEGGAPATSNFGSYVNPAFTATADSALGALDPKRSRAHWLRAFQTIVDDAPAIWLYEQKLIAGAHRRIELTNLRADGWSAGLADWTIPLTQRISRDRVGLR